MTSQPGELVGAGEGLTWPKCRAPLASSSGWAVLRLGAEVLVVECWDGGSGELTKVTAWWVHPVDGGACSVSRVGPSRMICRVFVNVFDALVHVSECRRKSASTAVGERVTETTGISPWEKVVTRLPPCCLASRLLRRGR